jgi:CheY-like chemotaxis protein
MEQHSFTAPDWRVLLVDDSELNREVEAAVLEPYEFQLTQAESGAEALALAREQAFDLIFMDYLMPDMDGIETTERIRRECGENGTRPVIVALTADESEDTAARFRASGCQDLLAKPVDPGALEQVLLRWVPTERLRPVLKAQAPKGMTEAELASLHMEGVDVEGSELVRGKSKAQYLQLLSLFHADGEKNEASWRDVGADRLDGYRIWVHALKSASANIGAVELSALAKAQEDAARAGDLDTVRSGSPAMFSVYDGVLDEIARVLRAEGDAAAPAETELEPPLDQEALEAGVRKALTLLEDFKAKDSARQVELLLCHQLPGGVRALLQETREQLRMYEDDAAEDTLRHTLNTMRG